VWRLLPSQVADQCTRNPETLICAAEKFPAATRRQSLQFECTFNLGDGPQSLIVVQRQALACRSQKGKLRCWRQMRAIAHCWRANDREFQASVADPTCFFDIPFGDQNPCPNRLGWHFLFRMFHAYGTWSVSQANCDFCAGRDCLFTVHKCDCRSLWPQSNYTITPGAR